MPKRTGIEKLGEALRVAGIWLVLIVGVREAFGSIAPKLARDSIAIAVVAWVVGAVIAWSAAENRIKDLQQRIKVLELGRK